MESSVFLIAALALAAGIGDDKALNPRLAAYVRDRIAEFDQIPAQRQRKLDEIADYVRERIEAGKPARLVFICTHNSRRSQMGQVWAQTAAAYYGVSAETYSGGTEATAFNPRAVAALQRAGFDIREPNAVPNPRYLVEIRATGEPIECFSKVYHESPNPKADFCAVMTCAQADKQCPVVAGAAVRILLPYDDPKAADDTAKETATYDERCAQIAREMLYVFARVRP